MYELYNDNGQILKNIVQKLYQNHTKLEPLCKNSIFTYDITQNNKFYYVAFRYKIPCT